MVLRSSNDNRASAIFFDYPACRMVTLTFIWLTPYCYRNNVKCVYIFMTLSVFTIQNIWNQ
jgi:hypothetical protein